MKILKSIISSKKELLILSGLFLLFYFIFIHNIWAYPLMDADETRYVSISRDMFLSKDFLTLKLNGEYFFEKPPLFFWIENLSFLIFNGIINEFTARFPLALISISICYFTYYVGKKVYSRTFGIISALILATSVEYCILSKFAILDIILTACTTFSIGFGLLTFFSKPSEKKYYWWLFYIFSALAVLAKGLPGFIIPFGSIFFVSIYFKTIKEALKPINIIPGILLFILIVLPWHIIMFKLYNPLFWNEYVIKHHLARFIGAKEIDRTEPLYFYIITLLWGFFPWIISFISTIFIKYKNLLTIIKLKSNISRFLISNFIITLFIFIFFSASETKLITYILPLFPFLSFLSGYIWNEYIYKHKYRKIINVTNYLIGFILLLVTISGLLSIFLLPKQLILDLGSTRIICILLCFACGLALIIFTKKQFYIQTFFTYVIFMALISAIATEKFFQIDYKFGQYDLMEFALIAEKDNKSLTTFKFGTKFSLIFYGKMPVVFGPQAKIFNFNEALDKANDYVIIKNKELKNYNDKDFYIIKSGRKYSLIDKR